MALRLTNTNSLIDFHTAVDLLTNAKGPHVRGADSDVLALFNNYDALHASVPLVREQRGPQVHRGGLRLAGRYRPEIDRLVDVARAAVP